MAISPLRDARQPLSVSAGMLLRDKTEPSRHGTTALDPTPHRRRLHVEQVGGLTDRKRRTVEHVSALLFFAFFEQ